MYVLHVSLQISNKFIYVVYLICIATAPALNCVVGKHFWRWYEMYNYCVSITNGGSGNRRTIHPKTWNLPDILVI